jgi:HEPN domain-containing protein
MFDQMANQDFNRALNRASWKKILNWLTGSDNKLLPYDEVRARLPIRGQHYIGLHQVPIEKIVGSMGRYNDFDRAFLPTQNRTKDRWISIDKAHYSDIPLPPVELIKIGEIFFVKDGNHRISVARERGQIDIDAYVTEIDIPIKLTADMKIDDLAIKEKQVEFMLETGLHAVRPEADVDLTDPDGYDVLKAHISTHRWYLGVEQKREVSYDEAVGSWYDHVYLPLAEEICAQNLLKSFPDHTEADLYLWIMEYQKYLRLAYSSEEEGDESAKAIAAEQLVKDYPRSDVVQLVQLINRTHVLDKIILDTEQANFYEQTHILEYRPDALIETTLPGKYDRLRDHIATHRWYLGEHRKSEVSYEEAVTSWYDHVYMPIVQVIREQDVMKQFPRRTETDLYLWIVRHQWYLRETYGEDVPIEKAAEEVAEQFTESATDSKVQKVVDALKKVAGQK